MFFFSQNTKPFYHELDFQSPYFKSYLDSISTPFSEDNFETINKNSIQHLQNILIFGPDGCGKSTQIYAKISTKLISQIKSPLSNIKFNSNEKSTNIINLYSYNKLPNSIEKATF